MSLWYDIESLRNKVAIIKNSRNSYGSGAKLLWVNHF
jgi:hypothetical protein